MTATRYSAPAGTPNGHHLVNRGNRTAAYLEVGNRSGGDEVYYLDSDLKMESRGGTRLFTHKDGTPY
jgi:uncharacterized cupin superfamily protein